MEKELIGIERLTALNEPIDLNEDITPEEEKSKAVGWNLAQFLTIDIAKNLASASEYFNENNLMNSFRCLIAVRNRISQHFSSFELRSFKKLQIDFFSSYSPSRIFTHINSSSEVINKKRVALNTLHNSYRRYNDLLMICLKKYGFDIPEKTDKRSMGA